MTFSTLLDNLFIEMMRGRFFMYFSIIFERVAKYSMYNNNNFCTAYIVHCTVGTVGTVNLLLEFKL